MARKKQNKNDINQATTDTVTEPATASVAVAEAPTRPQASAKATSSAANRPAWIDGPPTGMEGDDLLAEALPEAPPKNWGDPYKQIFSSTASGFEMGENRRYKQRVFKFRERPEQEVIDTLKDSGFTYRASEKAWTIQATPETRRISEELAHQFAGERPGRSR